MDSVICTSKLGALIFRQLVCGTVGKLRFCIICFCLFNLRKPHYLSETYLFQSRNYAVELNFIDSFSIYDPMEVPKLSFVLEQER